MSAELVKYAFIAGEISPTLFGRSDLTKYDLGMAEAYNFFVDYRGGLSSRPGTEFCATVKTDDKPTRFVNFSFSSDTEDNYLLVFGDNYLRFMQDGGYVLDAGVPYEIVTPYPAEALANLSFSQYRDTIRITSADYPVYDLIRNDHTDWVLSAVDVSPYNSGPGITSSSASTPPSGSTADSSVLFAVTYIDADGNESTRGPIYTLSGVVNYSIVEGSVSILFAPIADAVEYKVYRSIIAKEESLSYGSELGYVGRTKGTKFTDSNIIPDFGITPPLNSDPFNPGAITSIDVTAGGSGYAYGDTITVTGGGTGFAGEIIVDDSGAIVNVIIKSGGSGYVSPTVSFGGGTGATATVEARPMTGTYPALSCIFQQRQILAASDSKPITIWGSQPKKFSNFNTSTYAIDSDSFEFDLDTAAINPIRHLVVVRGGILAMTQDNIWLVNGGSQNEAITPTNVLADPHTYTGVSALRPIQIGQSLLYVEGKGYAVRLLDYSELARVYAGEDKSILSNHLFGADKEIVAWAYQESPFKVVWCVRSDGALLAFTIEKEQEVFAWTPCGTRGRFLDVITVREGVYDRIYLMVERYVNGSWQKFIERMDLRTFSNVEDAWCVDAGLALGGTSPAADITITSDGTTYTATASASVFAGSLNKILRAANGIFRVSSVTSNTVVELEVYSQPTNWIPDTGETQTFPILSGDWTLDTPVTTISGLDHLEGETVSILGDGNVFPQQVVSGGEITLPSAVTRCIVGLPYTARAKTLPFIVPNAGIEGRRKRIVGLAVRLTKSRGLEYGDSYETTYAMKERTTEDWGRPTELQEGIRYQNIGSVWDEEGQTCFKLEDPLPVTLLSLVLDAEIGDEPD